jgi:acetyl esterase/lipase
VLSSSVAQGLAGIGRELGPNVLAACTALFDDEQQALAARVPASVADLAYGPHERHRLDLYGQASQGARPVMLFVHGGGFVLGDKGGPDSWMNANVGRMAAEAGWLGAVMNYRLAPDHPWPAGSEDVGAAVDWLREHAGRFGGDRDRIFVAGTSAGAIHLAGYLRLAGDNPPIRGAVLLSGLYGFTQPDHRDAAYYGDPASYADRAPLEAVIETDIPLLVACAERDPARFQTEFVELMKARIDRKGAMPQACIISGHNHYSISMHLGTSDARLSDEIVAFVAGEVGR